MSRLVLAGAKVSTSDVQFIDVATRQFG